MVGSEDDDRPPQAAVALEQVHQPSQPGAPRPGQSALSNPRRWLDSLGRNWNASVPFALPDHDVFALDAYSLAHGTVFDSVGTILFNIR